MKILIISDTHINSIRNLHPKVISEIKNSDAVIHAGDIVGEIAYREIKSISRKLYAVRGNMDILTDELERKITFNIYDKKISVCHGDIYNDIYNGLLYDFVDSNIIIFGHTHHPYSKIIGKQHLINPGSTSKNRWKNKKSYVILEFTFENYTVNFFEI
ncbi:MAG: YfcE family phosphodiesterase [Calditerrivibrio sp.]|nr:YfcE family phosphodiesterase [Calditerrivibrio sp.]MCA1980683.1 YfcE family phosphodiesterase [Calditerrivibrio sp.]